MPNLAKLAKMIQQDPALAADDGTDAMREIAGAVQEGAAAYLQRQMRTLVWFVLIVFAVTVVKLSEGADMRSPDNFGQLPPGSH